MTIFSTQTSRALMTSRSPSNGNSAVGVGGFMKQNNTMHCNACALTYIISQYKVAQKITV
jgi:uncharacterized protein YbbK (DUF523 family)